MHPRRRRLSRRRAPEGVRHLGWLHRTEGSVCRQQRCEFFVACFVVVVSLPVSLLLVYWFAFFQC